MDTDDGAAQLIRALEKGGKAVVTIESCTAGALAVRLARQMGAGSTFHGGFVVYTKAQKTAAVGVPQQLLQSQSAVSALVAVSMACGALARSPADVALAVTGVAGPAPDEDGNPVGLVFVAAAAHDVAVAQELRLSGDRDEICDGAIRAAIRLALRTLASIGDTTLTG